MPYLKNVIYKQYCKKCGIHVVSETVGFLYIWVTGRSLTERFEEHRSNIAQKQGPTGSHFNLPGHSVADLCITGIEKVYGNERVRLKTLWHVAFWTSEQLSLHINKMSSHNWQIGKSPTWLHMNSMIYQLLTCITKANEKVDKLFI